MGPASSQSRLRASGPAGRKDLCFVWRGPIEGIFDHLRARGLDVEGMVPRWGARGDGSLLEFTSHD
jgi:hypothetical protein